MSSKKVKEEVKEYVVKRLDEEEFRSFMVGKFSDNKPVKLEEWKEPVYMYRCIDPNSEDLGSFLFFSLF